jgi:hypothetical protein
MEGPQTSTGPCEDDPLDHLWVIQGKRLTMAPPIECPTRKVWEGSEPHEGIDVFCISANLFFPFSSDSPWPGVR